MDNMEVKKYIAGELNKGVGLSEIQKRLAAEFNFKITFLDLRLLAAELENVDWAKQDPVPVAKPEEKKEAKPTDPLAKTGTVVELSKIARPGAMASGNVRFASGASADWVLDSTGRLGFEKVDGEPTKEDMQEFMEELKFQLSQGR